MKRKPSEHVRIFSNAARACAISSNRQGMHLADVAQLMMFRDYLQSH